jgi:hypothetical protein
MRKNTHQSGSILVSLLVIMIFLTITVLSLSVVSQTNITRAVGRIYLLQAQYAAESGADTAVAYLNAGGTFPNSGTEKPLFANGSQYRATYQTTLSDISGNTNQKQAFSIGRVYVPASATTPRYTYKISLTVDRSTTQFTSSIVSRNSVELASSVKAVQADSMLVNEYVKVNKNSSELAISDLTIGGKYPDAANCSLAGAGSLLRNSNLPAGTKAKLRMAYNNCMDIPPGNTSDADFDIIANDPTIQKIASLYIPWSFVMNNDDGGGDYTNGNCSDWSATSPVSIPSTGNARKTHYPDSGSGTIASSSCNGSGTNPADLNLGSKTYIIKDNVHIRANLCKASACSPTFVNPDPGTTKYIFVEGVINFENVYISNGVGYPNGGTVPQVSQGNIAFISYSTSQILPGSKQCPSNAAAIRLGKAGSDSLFAPNGYFIATNGMLCVDQTKFADGVSSVGGVSGKDIYISSNSGSSFSLTFNPSFPLSSIPLDLSWRASNVKRVY